MQETFGLETKPDTANPQSPPWLSVVGIGDDGWVGLSPIARACIDQAAVIVGGKRHLAMLPEDGRPRIAWAGPIADTMKQILADRSQRVCLLASGDPMCYGIGSTLTRYVDWAEMQIFPAPSAFSLACARLRWPLAEVEQLSLCGRDPALLNAVLYPGAKILILSADRTTPGIVQKLLCDQGYGQTQMIVLEHLGGLQERILTGMAADWSAAVADLHTIALVCPADAPRRSRLPGLPDHTYLHDGQLTKREIRAVTLSSLGPVPGEQLWDVGAGSGSIGIEWLRHDRRNRAIAIEHHPDRRQNIIANAQNLGVPNLQIVAGKAPAALADLAQPDAIFIGGGLTVPEVFETCWTALRSGGRLVANGVTVETEHRLFELQKQYGGELNRLAIQRAAPVGKFLGWKAMAGVTQWVVVKP
jgi:precorrin-6B C5,15-methyltransferase / cobalt-precorrin-6B C5,C15-methyltransferase